MRNYRLSLSLILCVVLLVGCSHRGTVPNAVLNAQVAETSGLACVDDQLWTLNDSGNASEIYPLSPQGDVGAAVRLPLTNVDWEAITAYGNTVFIGDIGNNSGQREHIVIHRFQLHGGRAEQLQSFTLQYPNKPTGGLTPYAHDFDAEALVALDAQTLLLFSKSWGSGISHVYKIELGISKTARIRWIADIEGLPGLITDATRIAGSDDIQVVGYINYRTNLLQFMLNQQFAAFTARISKDFTVLHIEQLTHQGQVEAISSCQHKFWFSAEQYQQQPAQLWTQSVQN